MIAEHDADSGVIMACTGGTDLTCMVSGSLNCGHGPWLMVGIPSRC
jgi:hypothetical protein